MLPAYGSRDTMAELAVKFPYIFDPAIVVPLGTSKPELAAHILEPGVPVSIAGVQVLPLSLPHGKQPVLGYRVGAMAYLTDVKSIPDSVMESLKGLDVFVLNALLPHPHPLHLSIPEAVEVARRVGARRTFFTHLTHEFTHAALAALLPPGTLQAFHTAPKKRWDICWVRYQEESGQKPLAAAATPVLTTLQHFRHEFEAHVKEGRCTLPADWRAKQPMLAGAH